MKLTDKYGHRQAKIIAARMFFFDLGGDDKAAVRRYNTVARTSDTNDDVGWQQLLWTGFEGHSTLAIKDAMSCLHDEIILRFTQPTP